MGRMMGGNDMPMMKMMQEMHAKMMGGGMATQPKGDPGPSSQAFNGSIAKMSAEMAIPLLRQCRCRLHQTRRPTSPRRG